jgi:hypothetical protein
MNSGGGHPQVVEGVSFLLFLIFQLSIYFLCFFLKLKKSISYILSGLCMGF